MVTRKIYLIGPSSTGKTTLCDAIAKRLSLPASMRITKVARDVIRSHGWTRKDIGLLEMQQAILDAHVQKEIDLIQVETPSDPSSGIALLSDRSAIDPVVYAILMSRNIEIPTGMTLEELGKARGDKLVKSRAFQEILPTYLSASTEFYLLELVPEWLEDDGFRHVGDQEESFGIFKRTLDELGVSYRVIGRKMKDLEERVAFVLGQHEQTQ